MSDPTTIKSVLITGAASGIGRATAILFAERGYRVALLDLESSDLEGTLKSLVHPERDHKKYYVDISSSEELSKAFESIQNDFGTLSAAINNAGIDPGNKRFTESSEADFDRVIGINLKGTFLCLQNELRLMGPQKSGSIVNVASILGIVGAIGTALYTASKHGVMGLTKSLAIEYARKGIRINAVCPGGVNTPMIEKVRETNPPLIAATEKMHPIGRFSSPEEIARAIFWLCSDEASFVVGTGLSIDGGYTAG